MLNAAEKEAMKATKGLDALQLGEWGELVILSPGWVEYQWLSKPQVTGTGTGGNRFQPLAMALCKIFPDFLHLGLMRKEVSCPSMYSSRD